MAKRGLYMDFLPTDDGLKIEINVPFTLSQIQMAQVVAFGSRGFVHLDRRDQDNYCRFTAARVFRNRTAVVHAVQSVLRTDSLDAVCSYSTATDWLPWVQAVENQIVSLWALGDAEDGAS